MKNSKNGNTLIGIVIGIFILSFSLLGIMNILNFNKDTYESYTESINNYILEGDFQNILSKLDISNLKNNEEFYIYKDTVNKEFKILTGAINEEYQYIDFAGNKIIPSENLGKTYKAVFTKKVDILKHVINPDEINNLAFHLDAQDINGDGTTPSDGSPISNWVDLSGNGNNFYLDISSYPDQIPNQPSYSSGGINGFGGISFNGTGSYLVFDKNVLVNNDDDCYSQFAYEEKTYAIVMKTGFNITSEQVIFEQGGQATGYNFMIYNGNLYAGIHNKADDTYACTDFSSSDNTFHFPWDSGNQYKSVDLGKILPDSVYFIMIVQDSTHLGESGDSVVDDSNNTLKIYLNGLLVSSTDHVDPQPEHHVGGLGAVNAWNVRPWDTNPTTNTIKAGDLQGGCDTQCLFFEGIISEFISWNHALSNTEIRGIQNYFIEKWLNGKSNIQYNIVNTDVKKFNQ